MFFCWQVLYLFAFARVCRCWNGEKTQGNSEKKRQNGEKQQEPRMWQDWNGDILGNRRQL